MSFRTILQHNVGLARRRFASSVTAPKPPVPDAINKKNDFKTNYLSDPSTYPLFVIMTMAGALAIGMSLNALRYKNWKISPSAKHETLAKDSSKQTPLTEIVSREPITFHPQAMKDTRAEKKGLGVEHQELLSSKGTSQPSD